MRCRVTKKPQFKLGGANPLNAKTSKSMGAVPREQANLEAEGGENVVGDVNGDGFIKNMNIVGPSHAQGGVPMNLSPGNFIYSDDKSMKISDAETLAMFGVAGKKSVTPAHIAKRFPLNDFMAKLKDKNSNAIEKRTAEAMIENNTKKLAELAMVQEGMKGFKNGVPAIASSVLSAGEQGMPQARFGGSLDKFVTGGDPPIATGSTFYINNQKATIKSRGNSLWGGTNDEWVHFDEPISIDGSSNKMSKMRVKDLESALKKEINMAKSSTGSQWETLDELNFFQKKASAGLGSNYSKIIASSTKDSVKHSDNEYKKDTEFSEGNRKWKITNENVYGRDGSTGATIEKLEDDNNDLSAYYDRRRKFVSYEELNKLMGANASSTGTGKNVAPSNNDPLLVNETPGIATVKQSDIVKLKDGSSFTYFSNGRVMATEANGKRYMGTGKKGDNVKWDEGNLEEGKAPAKAVTNKTDNKTVVTNNTSTTSNYGALRTKYKQKLGGELLPEYGTKGETKESAIPPPFKNSDILQDGVDVINGVSRRVVQTKDKKTYVKQGNQWHAVDFNTATDSELSVFFNPDTANSANDSEIYDAASEKGLKVTKASVDYNSFGRQSKNASGFYTSGDNTLDMNDFAVRQKPLMDKSYQGGFDQWVKDVNDPAKSESATESFQNIYDQYAITTTGKPYFTGIGAGKKDGLFGQYTWSAPSLMKEEVPTETKNVTSVAGTIEDPAAKIENQGQKFSDSWTQQDLNNFVTAASMDIAKVRPTLHQVPITQMDPTFTDPSRQIAARQEQYNKLADFFGNSADGQTARANMLVAAGESAEGISNDIAQSNAQNVGIANNVEQFNTQMMQQGLGVNANLKKTFEDESATFLQNLTNAKNKKSEMVTAAFNRGVTNEQMYNKWLPTLIPEFRADAWSGKIGFTGKGDHVTDPYGTYAVDAVGNSDEAAKQYAADKDLYGEFPAQARYKERMSKSTSGSPNNQALMMQLLQQMNNQ